MIRQTLCVLACAAQLATAASVDLESYASGFDTLPVAVVTFRSTGGTASMADEPWRVIADDLAFSPRFRVVRAPKADSASLLAAGAGIYVDGEYSTSGEEIALECFVRDAARGEVLLGRKYAGNMRQVRSMAHRFANQLVESLLGERGIFESRIVFVKRDGAAKDIHVMDYDGHHVRRLTRTTTVNVFPAFADSGSLVWVSFQRGKPDIYHGSLLTGQSKAIIYSRAVQTSPCYNPVEGRLAYASSKPGNMEIFVSDTDGGRRQQLTFRGGIDTSPCWSPTGYQIAFTSDRSGQPQIYVMDADGSNTRRLTYEGTYQDSPSWSPRGDRIAYASYHDGLFNIWTIAPDGSEPRQVSSNPGSNEYPSWSPDGQHIVYVCRQGSRSDLYVVRASGGESRRLTNTGDVSMPDWERL